MCHNITNKAGQAGTPSTTIDLTMDRAAPVLL
jgi:hypothetical protein